MNVREGLLRRRIDPTLTPETLSVIACDALGAPVRVEAWEPLTGGCWNRVICLRGDWPSFWLPRWDAVMAEVSRSSLLDPGFLARIDALRPRMPAVLDIGETSTLTHYDIWSGNIMVGTSTGAARVSGYVDVPGYWADPVRELSFAEMFGVADGLFYEVYTSSHALPDGWQLRRALYNLKMHLKHVTMYPEERYYRVGAARCLSLLEAGT